MDPIYIERMRLSFPHITQPHSSGANSPPKYSADLMIPATDPQVAKIQEAAMAVAQATFADKAQQILAMAMQDRQLRSFGPGENKVQASIGSVYQGYEGQFFVTASNQMMPQMVKADGVPVDPANTMESQQVARLMYGGCYVNAVIKPWPQNNANGKTVRWELVALQFAGDGEPFGSNAPVDVSGMFKAAAPAGTAAPVPPAMTPPGMVPPAAPQPVQGADGRWYDPISGQPVAAPQMPGYPQ